MPAPLAWAAVYRNHFAHCNHGFLPVAKLMTEKLDFSALRNALISLEESIAIVRRGDWFAQQTQALQNP